MSSDGTVQALNAFWLRSPLNRWLGRRITAFDRGSDTVEFLLSDRPELRRLEGEPATRGGVVAAMVDIAAHRTL